MVYLVGAGPGDDGLLTVKGLEKIKAADVIVYDRLVNPTVVSYAKNGCKLIYAGKISGNHNMSQEEINDTLIKYGGTLNVVRLKGGDPFVFGRGSEEVKALLGAGIPYEIVSGVSSCYSAAQYCGIPVTHRGTSSSFHVITAHKRTDGGAVDYSALAKLDGTLVFLMGLAAAQDISEGLIKNGKSPSSPAAVISHGTDEKQQCIAGTLKDLRQLSSQMASPAVIIIGDVVTLQKEWFKPSGKTILATGTPSVNAQIKKAAGAISIKEIPIIKITPINFDLFAKTNLRDFSHIAFTSSNGVDIFFDYMKKTGQDIRIFRDTKFAVVGKKTALRLEEKGIFADIVPDFYCSKALCESLCGAKCENVLLVRSENGTDTVSDTLSKNGISFTDLNLYKTETDFSKKELLNIYAPEADYIIFSSGSAAKAFSQMLETETNAKFISIGQETTKTANGCSIPIYKTAKTATAEGIIECISERL